MKKVRLVFGTYNSVPLGSADDELERVYQTELKPFLTTAYASPEILLVLYYSGILLEWLEEHHPEFIMLLVDMASRKQVELLGGGYYDPVFTIIPGADRIGQIEYLTTYLRKRFGRRPRGSWITCGVWEPSLATAMRNSGIDYVFLDEALFPSDGMYEAEKCVPCITEDQGKTVTVFPLTTSLSRRIPADAPETVMEGILEYAARKKDHIVSLILPSRAFSVSPRTETGTMPGAEWLESFIGLLDEKRERVETFQPARFAKTPTKMRKLYFPGTGTNGVGSYGDGGFRGNLVRFHTSNLLYSKMIYACALVNQMRGDKYRKRTAKEMIWKGQNHFPYWDAEGQGIRSNQTRKTAYSSLIEAERMTREKGIFKPSIVAADFDMDGLQEYLFQGDDLNAYTHRSGGILFEVDYIPKLWNYLDVYKERSPQRGNGEERQGKTVEWYPGGAFIDHFLPRDCAPSAFRDGSYQELGDFINREYEIVNADKDRHTILFSAMGKLHIGNQCYAVSLEKRYAFSASGVTMILKIVNAGEKRFTCSYGSEINLSFGGADSDFFQIFSNDNDVRKDLSLSEGRMDGIQNLMVDDKRNHLHISLQADKLSEVWVSNRPAAPGNDENSVGTAASYQGTCFLFKWEISLDRKEEWGTSLSLSFAKKRGKKAPAAV
jgi:alpha-amylase